MSEYRRWYRLFAARVGDPELKFGVESKKPYCRCRIAVNTPKVPGDWAGERETTYYDVYVFGGFAENVVASLSRGDRVVVVGRSEIRTWKGDDEVEHREKSIIADSFGPDLRWATAEVSRTKPAKGTSAQPTEDSRDAGDFDEDF